MDLVGELGAPTKFALSGSALVEELVGFATPGCMSTPLLPPRVTSVSLRDMAMVCQKVVSMWQGVLMIGVSTMLLKGLRGLYVQLTEYSYH